MRPIKVKHRKRKILHLKKRKKGKKRKKKGKTKRKVNIQSKYKVLMLKSSHKKGGKITVK